MYNPAFDPFNGIYRMLNILKHFDVNECVEVDRLRIYDFYLLFPYKAYKIRLQKRKPGLRNCYMTMWQIRRKALITR